MEPLSGALGQRVVVENRGGAGGNIAGEAAARAEADGYTMLVAGQAIVAINKALYKKLSYDPATDFTFVGMLGVSPNLLLVNPNAVPVNSVAELIALARKRPGEIAYASNGPGSLTHLTSATLAKEAGIELLHVPYQGAAPLMTDLIAGRIGMTFTAASTALPLVQSGQLRAIAVTTGQRSQFSPDIPTLVESGFPMLDAPTWFAVMMRTATPITIIARLRSEVAALTSREDYANALKKNFFEVMRLPPEGADVYLAKERKLWIEAVKVAGVAIE
jgi:tripartite-type tricarboxylate transporter receptor subunit TctC